MKILKYPNPILLRKAQPVEVNDELRAWCKEAEELCDKVNSKLGILAGMAAPQMGRSIRAFVLHNFMKDPGVPKYRWIINPELTWLPKAPLDTKPEGCYSLALGKFNYMVRRHYAVRMKYQDLEGAWHEDKFKNTMAQVVQHEYDHLEGRCCNHEMNEKLERMPIKEWATEFGYELLDPDGFDRQSPDLFEKLYTEEEFRVGMTHCTVQRASWYNDRKRNLDAEDNRFQYDTLSPMEITPDENTQKT